MRKNNTILAAAMAATFMVSMNASYAGLANYPECTDATAASCATSFTTSGFATGAAAVTFILAPIPDITQGIIYGTHLFGDSGDNVVLPTDTNNTYAAAVWTIEGTPKDRMQLIATIQGAEFNTPTSVLTDYPMLAYSGTANNPLAQGTYTKSCTATQCTWRFGTDGTTSLKNGDKFIIVYKLAKAGATLGTDGGKVTMGVKIGTVTSPSIIAAEQIITVATGKEPFKVNFQSTDNSYIKVDVSAENKNFTDEVPSSLKDNEFINTSEAIFGYMFVTPEDNVKMVDGYTKWNLDNVDGDTTILTINEQGQFNASITGGNGSVYLSTLAGPVAAESVTSTDAVWKLSGTELGNVLKSVPTPPALDSRLGDCNQTSNYTTPCVPIIIKADGVNVINVPEEDGPKAVLDLSYVTPTSKKNILYPAKDAADQRLAKYGYNGISCWVFNVPYQNAIDTFQLRIINDSSTTPMKADGSAPSDDCVTGVLYKTEGGDPIAKGPLGCPRAGGALYVSTNDLISKLSLPTGTGRGIMYISSTLQKMEVLAMLRRKSPPCFGDMTKCEADRQNPLTNFSTGAHGVACAPEYR